MGELLLGHAEQIKGSPHLLIKQFVLSKVEEDRKYMCEWLANRQTVDFKRNLKPMMVQVQQPIILLAIYSLSFSKVLVSRQEKRHNAQAITAMRCTRGANLFT